MASVTILKDSSTGEYRVPAKDGKEAGAYYTDDKQDAIDTAKMMYKDTELTVKFRTVSDFDKFQESVSHVQKMLNTLKG